MKNVIIFEDGKICRGSKAKLIKKGNKRVLIEFYKYDYKSKEDVLVQEWFKLFIPSYSSNKKNYKHNNKRKYAKYCHDKSNEFYSDEYQTENFKNYLKESLLEEYFNELYK